MSLESHLRESVLRTALLHLMKNQNKSPERTARNIAELLSLMPNPPQKGCPQYEELLRAVQSYPGEEFLSWIMKRLS